ncbi:Agamous-like MADS-box protein AGL17 [Cardamine amara subsp. amara]
MAKGAKDIGVITCLVIFLMLTGIPNGMTYKVPCEEGLTLWVKNMRFLSCSTTLCEDNCVYTQAYKGGRCDIEKDKAICRCYRCKKNQLTGEQSNGLSVKELHNLESQLEMSLRGIRMKKAQILTIEIKELTRKRNLDHHENLKLSRNIQMIHQENVELYKKAYAPSRTNGLRHDELDNAADESHAQVRLQLSQPDQSHYETPSKS